MKRALSLTLQKVEEMVPAVGLESARPCGQGVLSESLFATPVF